MDRNPRTMGREKQPLKTRRRNIVPAYSRQSDKIWRYAPKPNDRHRRFEELHRAVWYPRPAQRESPQKKSTLADGRVTITRTSDATEHRLSVTREVFLKSLSVDETGDATQTPINIANRRKCVALNVRPEALYP